MSNYIYYSKDVYSISKIDCANKILKKHAYNPSYCKNKKVVTNKSFKETLKDLKDTSDDSLNTVNSKATVSPNIITLSENSQNNNESIYKKIQALRSLKSK